ncbi:glycosyltransferase family 2 protein [Halobacillus locisalis]|uniref:Glycosyltransferase family 2 protein n=1 Tax=Halobacillus locisalis TaxID=220753 RepID=A0A838CTU8_9BACI|nr:glycosyltransferase [Halobacillus locisalis]MBA2175410.1 glycosyltransferase family 2 protein [Halobacillus locisalis]
MNYYIPVQAKFWVGHIFAILWTSFAIYISVPWVVDLAEVVSLPFSIFIISGIAYIPGYMNAFLIISIISDKQPPLKEAYLEEPVTILMACRNEQGQIANTLTYIKSQKYSPDISVIIVDNGSSDKTTEEAENTLQELDLSGKVVQEENPGKFNALNKGLEYVETEFVITLDADTLLHSRAVKYLVARIITSPENVCAIAGSVLVRNSRETIITRMQEWDYFLAIASIKRLQGLFQGTLVAQGAFSLYKTKTIKELGGWPDAIGEDIVLTWNMLYSDQKVFFEPLAVAFTEVPSNLKEFITQRSRWARGMIEALKETKPWDQPMVYTKYLTGINLIMPFLDFCYTFFWLPGVILAFFGVYWIVGPMTLLVLPLTLISYSILYKYQKEVFKDLNLRVRKNIHGFLFFVLFYQVIMAPVSVWGYLQEWFKLKRIWG